MNYYLYRDPKTKAWKLQDQYNVDPASSYYGEVLDENTVLDLYQLQWTMTADEQVVH